ncbi:MAG: hypothetical protein GXO76_04965 [Calditrichaeota bacterium]|nr:hypothetical protein [Calditrichota bacterium]
MKGVIVNSLENQVKDTYGHRKWEDILEKAGLSRDSFFLAIDDIDDSVVLKVIGAACSVLNITQSQLGDEFGEYWVNTYAPKYYKIYYMGITSAKEFLLKMNDLHQNVTKSMPNAHPPHFEYETVSDNRLIMTYVSHRGLMDFMIGLIKGVGHYYKENLSLRQLPDNQIEITFK